jgi:hypothetical protein
VAPPPRQLLPGWQAGWGEGWAGASQLAGLSQGCINRAFSACGGPADAGPSSGVLQFIACLLGGALHLASGFLPLGPHPAHALAGIALQPGSGDRQGSGQAGGRAVA